MRASKQEQTGAQGISEVRAKFQALGWGPAENPHHDHGTDLYIQPRDERLFDLQSFLGAQVKSGPSYFAEPFRKDGNVVGWWYREEDGDHFDYWIGHALPHLLVIHDLEEHVSYWVLVTADAVQSTGNGNKILVPAHQRVEPEQLDSLRAAAQKPTFSLEGTAWTIGSSKISPGQRFRFALLAPRLVAPHPNAGYNASITPMEAIALLVQGRVSNVLGFVKHHKSIPDPSKDAFASADWEWRFVAAFWRWVAEGTSHFPQTVIDEAPDSPRRTAATIVCACMLIEAEENQAALEHLDRLISKDEADPVDWAWLHVHRGRLRFELGDFDGARSDGLAAGKAIEAHRDDVTASAIAAAGSWLVWQTLDWPERNVDELVRSTDTAISWWRAQTISWALAEASERSFNAWADDNAMRFASEDVLHNRLLAATLGAHLSGEHGSWLSNLSLLARHELMSSHAGVDVEGVEQALSDLRQSGDHASLSKAARRVWRIGPLAALSKAVGRIQKDRWSHTTAQTNFKLWAAAGDLLRPEQASDAAWFCLSILKKNFPSELLHARPTFLVDLAALDALPSLLSAAGTEIQRAMLSFIAGLGPEVDELNAIDLVDVVRLIEISSLPKEEYGPLRAFALTVQRPNLAGAILGCLSQGGDTEAQHAVLERARSGDLYALRELVDLTELEVSEASKIIVIAQQRVEEIIDKARKNSWSLGGFNYVALLAVFNSYFPEAAAWDPLLDALGEPRVAINDKAGACRALTENVDRVPPNVRNELAKLLDSIAATEARFMPGEEGSLVGVVEHLALALGVLNPQDGERRLARLAMMGWEERRDLAYALSGEVPTRLQGTLAALAGDENVNVRAAAARTAARRLATGAGGNIEREVVARLARSEGALVPLAVLIGLSQNVEAFDAEVRNIVIELSTHPSARVRSRAGQVRG